MYVAEFVGKPRMSLVEGIARARARTASTFVGQGLRIELGPAGRDRARGWSPSDVVLGVRAEDVDRVDRYLDIGGPGFEAKVGLIEPIGSDTFVELEAGEASIVARVDPDLSLALDQPVRRACGGPGSTSSPGDSGERIN